MRALRIYGGSIPQVSGCKHLNLGGLRRLKPLYLEDGSYPAWRTLAMLD